MAGHWPLKAVRQGLVGFATTNGPPVMTPWGGRAGAICNNPFSWGIPAGEELPILLDMALTAGARGRVRLADQQGETIPEGWALDAEGAPTTDAAAALAGVMLPMGAHKGSGIAVVNEVLSSALSGALFLTQITSTTMASSGVHVSWRVGHFFLVLDPEAFRPRDEFLAGGRLIVRAEGDAHGGELRRRDHARRARVPARGRGRAPRRAAVAWLGGELRAVGEAAGVPFPRVVALVAGDQA